MASCLGIYVDKNLIKYAKLKKVKDTFKIESYNVEVFEDLEVALKKVISETNSYKIPISINISNELYNYFDVFSGLEKKDITKALDIEFEMLCADKKYDKKSLTSRYILMDNKENPDKYKALYISANKYEIEKIVDDLEEYRLLSMAPVSTSITNLIEADENENIAIVNLENETTITTIIDGQINRVDILNYNIESVVEKINQVELSWKKSYDLFKNITIYNKEVKSLDENENEYIDLVMPALTKIAHEIKKIFKNSKEKVSKIYITGMGATISNIDLFLQEYFDDEIKCEILKPFFVDSANLKVPIKEYIEVNSAISLALDGLGFVNKDLNFAPSSKFDNLEIENIINAKEEFDIKKWKEYLKEPMTLFDKMLIRLIIALVISIICYCIFSASVIGKIKSQTEVVNQKNEETTLELNRMNKELSEIQGYTNTFISIMNNANSSSELTLSNQNKRVISQDAIPNLLNKLMFVIPQNVQLISIENTEEKHIVIIAISKNYEGLTLFKKSIEDDEILKNVEYASEKMDDSTVKYTIEGDLQ